MRRAIEWRLRRSAHTISSGDIMGGAFFAPPPTAARLADDPTAARVKVQIATLTLKKGSTKGYCTCRASNKPKGHRAGEKGP